MATVTVNDHSIEANLMVKYVTVVPGTVSAGGEELAAADCGLSTIIDVQATTTEDGYAVSWDKSAGKIKYFEAGADGAVLDEATGDLSATLVEARVTGRP